VYDNPIAAFTVSEDSLYTDLTLVNFNNNSQHAVTYDWDFGDFSISSSTNPSHYFPETPGDYSVTLTAYNEAGCFNSTSMIITIEEQLNIYIPNTFTPNQDEYNNVFIPILTTGFKKDNYHFTIYNRWGEIVFESYDPEVGWDGSYQGIFTRNKLFVRNVTQEICQDGTYIWTLEIEETQSARIRKLIGHVNLLGKAK
jgi:gliding motility-associated-like protein